MAERAANKIPACREYARRLYTVLSAWPPLSKGGEFKIYTGANMAELIPVAFHGDSLYLVEMEVSHG